MKKTYWLKAAAAFLAAIVLCAVCSPALSYAAADSSGTVKDWLESGKSGGKTDSSSTADKPAATTATGSEPNLLVTFLKLAVALLIVLALIYLLYRFAAGRRGGRFAQTAALKNLGGVSVGANRSVQMIRVGNEVLVVGVGESVQLLKEIRDPQVIDQLTNRPESPDPIEENVLKAFKWTTNHAFHRGGKPEQTEDQPPAGGQEREQQLNAVNAKRTRQLSDLIQEVVKK